MRMIMIGLVLLLWGNTSMATPAASLLEAAGLRAMDEAHGAADFTLSSPEGQQLRLQDQRGKVVLLNFWATWCPPCVEEMPLMNELYQSLKEKAFLVWAVAMKQDSDKVVPFLAKYNFKFTTLLDPTGDVSKRYRLRGLPTTYLIDCKGNTIGLARGPQKWTSKPMHSLMTALLGDPSCG